MYTRDEVHMLMCKAFNQALKKADVIEAGLEAPEADVECAWILTNHDSTPKTESVDSEYAIINKTDIEKRIEEWETELQECFKAPVGEFNSDYVSTLQQAINTAREISSQSIPLIPEIEKAWINGNTPKLGEFAHLIEDDVRKQDYISNLKLDI